MRLVRRYFRSAEYLISTLQRELLEARGLPHHVLNARQDAAEAEIVAQAGRAGRITVATNMAGRGTDIALDEAAAELRVGRAKRGITTLADGVDDGSRLGTDVRRGGRRAVGRSSGATASPRPRAADRNSAHASALISACASNKALAPIWRVSPGR